MNLLDFAVTPMWRVFEAVRDRAAEGGAGIRESELNGLAPMAAFDAVAEHGGMAATAPLEERFAAAAGFLQLRDPDPEMALERRLAAVREAVDGARRARTR